MLKGVGTVAVWSGGGRALPHTPSGLDGTWSRLEGKQMHFRNKHPNFRVKENSQ